MNITKYFNSVLFLVLFAGALDANAEAGFIINGGFETGDFTGWTLSNNTDINGVDNTDPHSGNYAAYFGQITADGPVSLSQQVTTIPGNSYTFSFWLTAEPFTGFQNAPNEFRASVNGNTLIDLINVSAFSYTQYEYTIKATSLSTRIQFDVANDSSYFDLDDVNFAASNTIPEPTSMIPFGIGMVTLAGYGLNRRQASSK